MSVSLPNLADYKLLAPGDVSPPPEDDYLDPLGIRFSPQMAKSAFCPDIPRRLQPLKSHLNAIRAPKLFIWALFRSKYVIHNCSKSGVFSTEIKAARNIADYRKISSWWI